MGDNVLQQIAKMECGEAWHTIAMCPLESGILKSIFYDWMGSDKFECESEGTEVNFYVDFINFISIYWLVLSRMKSLHFCTGARVVWRNDDKVLLFHGSILELAIKIVAMMQQGKHSQPLQLSVSKNNFILLHFVFYNNNLSIVLHCFLPCIRLALMSW